MTKTITGIPTHVEHKRRVHGAEHYVVFLRAIGAERSDIVVDLFEESAPWRASLLERAMQDERPVGLRVLETQPGYLRLVGAPVLLDATVPTDAT